MVPSVMDSPSWGMRTMTSGIGGSLRQGQQRRIDDVIGIDSGVAIQISPCAGLAEAVDPQGYRALAEDRPQERECVARAVGHGHQRGAPLLGMEQDVFQMA